MIILVLNSAVKELDKFRLDKLQEMLLMERGKGLATTDQQVSPF